MNSYNWDYVATPLDSSAQADLLKYSIAQQEN